MKKVIKSSMFIVVMITTMMGYSKNSNSLMTEKEPTSLTFKDVKFGQKLIIKDSYGSILYKEFMKKSGDYSKQFDLTELPDGMYYFELDKDVEINIIPFNVVSNNVTFNKKDQKVIFKPFLRMKDNAILLSKLSLNLESLEVALYFEDEKIYSEKIENTKKIERVYRLSKHKKGDYKVVMKSEGRTFVEYVKI